MAGAVIHYMAGSLRALKPDAQLAAIRRKKDGAVMVWRADALAPYTGNAWFQREHEVLAYGQAWQVLQRLAQMFPDAEVVDTVGERARLAELASRLSPVPA